MLGYLLKVICLLDPEGLFDLLDLEDPLHLVHLGLEGLLRLFLLNLEDHLDLVDLLRLVLLNPEGLLRLVPLNLGYLFPLYLVNLLYLGFPSYLVFLLFLVLRGYLLFLEYLLNLVKIN